MATKSNERIVPQHYAGSLHSRYHRVPRSGGKRQYRHRQTTETFSNYENTKKFLESSKSFLEQSAVNKSPWTREDLKIANGILYTWSRQKTPKELQTSWIVVADQLMNTSLNQYLSMKPLTQESSTEMIPNSTVFCNIITMYSRINLPHSADRADYWLQRMIKISKLYPDCVTPPRATLFANVLSAWEKSNLPHAEERAEKIWKQLKSTKGLSPTSSAYYLFISLLSKSELPESAERAEKILREMLREARRDPKLLPSCPVFVNVISAWRRRNAFDPNHAERAQAILDLMVKEYTRRSKLPQKWMRFSINDVPFNATIDAWAKSSAKLERIENRIDKILNTMDEMEVHCTMVTAWSALPLYSSRNVDGTEKTIRNSPTKLLRLLDSSFSKDEGGKNPMLQNQIFIKAMEICSALSRNGSEHSAEIAEEILLDRYLKKPRKDRRTETTMIGFEHAIRAWKYDTKHDVESKEQRMISLLEKMEKEVDHIYMHTHKKHPSIGKLYGFLAKVWAMSYDPKDALERASHNIECLLASFKAQSDFKSSPFLIQDAIHVVQEYHSGKISSDFKKNVYSKILANETLFFRMMQDLEVPDTLDYDPSVAVEEFLSGCLDALLSSKSSDAGKRAEIILLKQQELYEDGMCLKPTFETFNKVLTCWSNSEEEGSAQRMENMLLLANSLCDAGDKALQPDFEGYMTVITAWSRSHAADAPDKIQDHLKTLYQRRLVGDETFSINFRVYAALIRAYANSGRSDAQAMAYSIFESAPNDFKDTALYNLLIEAQGGDANTAEEILRVMHMSYIEGNDNVKPNTETFNALIQTWLVSGDTDAAWRADAIFNQMEELSETGKLDVKPNSRTFDLVISTLAQDWGAELAKVDVYLALLKKRYLAGDFVPTSTSYTEAIRAWASKNDDPKAILRAHALLNEMHELVRDGVDTMRPNRATYKVYLEGVSQSLLEDRTQLVDDVLLKMKENEFDLDNDLRSSIQRCLLPVNSRANSWVVDVEE